MADGLTLETEALESCLSTFVAEGPSKHLFLTDSSTMFRLFLSKSCWQGDTQ